MEQTLVELRKKCVVGFVGGSDLSKQIEQLGSNGMWSPSLPIIHARVLQERPPWQRIDRPCRWITLVALQLIPSGHVPLLHSFLSTVLQNFDYCFSENGLTAYKMGVQLASQVFCPRSILEWCRKSSYWQILNGSFISRHKCRASLVTWVRSATKSLSTMFFVTLPTWISPSNGTAIDLAV